LIPVENIGELKLHCIGAWILLNAQDESRIRQGNGAENFAILRHIALNLLKTENTAKIGIKNKRLKAGWDEVYLEKVLAGLAL
jgi:hypothetical protein